MKPEVIMYTVPLWPNCFRAKRFLSGKGILFTEKNVLIPKNFKERLKVTNAPGGPVTVVGERILMRFSSAEFEEVFRDFWKLKATNTWIKRDICGHFRQYLWEKGMDSNEASPINWD